jgi:uncharacterized protein (TIGR00369 family)
LIEEARRIASMLAAAPYGARLELRPREITAERVTASVPYSDLLANAQGYIHGGVAASLSIWAAMIATVATDRDARGATPVSATVSYLAPARQEELDATARIVSRGRELAHVAVDVAGAAGTTVASAMIVVRSRLAPPVTPVALPPDDGVEDAAGTVGNGARSMISPFSRAMGMVFRSYDASGAVLTMRREVNEGLGGAIDPGALLAMADTCAALACLPSIDERMRGSATLSLSAVFGDALLAPAVAVGRSVAKDGEIRSALVEVGSGSEASRPAMTACVAYRFLAARERG